jgi:ribonucleoside-diphosphate reductase alpha chain
MMSHGRRWHPGPGACRLAGTGRYRRHNRVRRACERAAVVQTADWHPDIEEFITAKINEEKKAHALIDAGYDGSYNGDAYASVAFQNVNQSVRVSDEFMEKAIENIAGSEERYALRSPATGETLATADPADLLDMIAEGTWFCGDPGVQYAGTIDRWHTVSPPARPREVRKEPGVGS